MIRRILLKKKRLKLGFGSLLVATLSFLSPQLVFGKVSFNAGFAIVDGTPRAEIDNIDEKTLVFCPSHCVIRTRSSFFIIDTNGFGAIADFPQGQEAKKALFHFFSEAKRDSPNNEKQRDPAPASSPPLNPTPEPLPSPGTSPPPPVEEPHQIEAKSPTNGDVRYPYPKENSLFLVSHLSKVNILPKDKCSHPCSLEVIFNGKSLKKLDFNSGSVPMVKVDARPESEGVYTWSLTDGSAIDHGTFEIKNIKNNGLKEALKTNREIIMAQ